MTYKIYYDEREIRGLDETVEIVNNEITDVIDNYYNICVEQSLRIKETIKEIEAYQSDNENYRENLNSEKTQNKFDELEKSLSEDDWYDEYQKYLKFLDNKYPQYDGDSFKSDEVEKDLNLAYKYQDQNNESLKKLKELMNKLQELGIYEE